MDKHKNRKRNEQNPDDQECRICSFSHPLALFYYDLSFELANPAKKAHNATEPNNRKMMPTPFAFSGFPPGPTVGSLVGGAVLVGVSVKTTVAVSVGVAVGLSVGVLVAVGGSVFVAVGVCVLVAVGGWVFVAVGGWVFVAVGGCVFVAVGGCVFVAVGGSVLVT